MKQKSLRQLARKIGVSASYLSQVRHGKRPASEKVLSRMLSNDIDALRHTAIAPGEGSSYNVNLLGISLAVGRLTLDQLGQVRILDPQPG